MATNGVRRKCQDCEEEILDNYTICRICGGSIVTVATNSSIQESNGPRAALEDSFRELFGEDVMSAFGDLFSEMAPSRKVSSSYFETLAKVVVDESKSILYDSYLEINGLKLLATLASFIALQINLNIQSRLVLGIPEFGEAVLTDDCYDNIVILRRGKVSFVQKALAAQNAGAKALIVIQDTEKWPFVMTDSTNERSKLSEILTIPVAMISSKDGAFLEDVIQGKKRRKKATSTAAAESLELIGCFGILSMTGECIVCRDDFAVGSTIVKLPCRHLYHADCLKMWVDRHNTCPMCRQEMPS